ncbi:ABC transporter ATP-binding protein [Mycoplasma hyopneumoniae]|uniref:ATP-binding cassette domain-containing protein n=1 Tax=Mesomycoplasma hyopneumoniae TaxID=2099 RepID=UPI001371B145|nr:ABC transporter ATP-binding protein [Mesomycoplasma hyopneumoniae]MXR44229.1 ABC transporter ATP-binding protein [Mesomycoplasma hyopneumoniae]
MKLFSIINYFINLNKPSNIFIFFLKFLLHSFLNLHLFTYSYLIKFIKNKVETQNPEFITWICISVVSFVLFFIIELILIFKTNNVLYNTKRKNINFLTNKIAKESYDYILENKTSYISKYNVNLSVAFSMNELIYSILFSSIFNIPITILFLFLTEVNIWIIILHCVIALIISIIILINFSSVLNKLQEKLEKILSLNAKKQIKFFSLFKLFYFFNKRKIFKTFLKNQVLDKYTKEFKLLKQFYYNQYFLEIIFSVFLFSSLITLSVLTYTKTFPWESFISLFSLTTSFIFSISSVFSFTLIFKTLTPYLEIFITPQEANSSTKIELNEEIKSISIKNLNFKYNENEMVFQNLNLEFLTTKKYGIISPSGRGKSTLLKLISGLITNYEGQILINNKLEYKSISDESLRKNIALLTNENVIFQDTLENNIILWDKNLNKKKLEFLVNKYEILEFSDLNKEINNSVLSEGEKQKIALARLEYQDLNIICLDEAFDNIYKDDVLKIYKDFLSQKNKTVFIVSHHIPKEIKHLFDEIIEL